MITNRLGLFFGHFFADGGVPGRKIALAIIRLHGGIAKTIIFFSAGSCRNEYDYNKSYSFHNKSFFVLFYAAGSGNGFALL